MRDDNKSNNLYKCQAHKQQAVFFCYEQCNTFLCQKCFLSHKMHIDYIILVDDILKDIKNLSDNIDSEQIKKDLTIRQEKNLEKIEDLTDLVFQVLQQNRIQLQKQYYQKNWLSEQKEAKYELFLQNRKSNNIQDRIYAVIQMLEFQKEVKNTERNLCVDNKVLHKKFLEILRKNYYITKTFNNYNTLDDDMQVFLHYFQWEKREINMIDVNNLTNNIMKLVTPYKILQFSRSIVVPSGNIYLLGGEIQQDNNRTNFMFSVKNSELDQSLYQKSSLIEPVYDFACVYSNGHIYVFGGKDKDKNIHFFTQCYSIQQNKWTLLKNSIIKRFAHSAFFMNENKSIYLVGGRDNSNEILSSQIEIYDIDKDEWELKFMNLPNYQIPVEIPCCIQIEPFKVLIFGGLDKNFKQKKDCCIMDCKKFQLHKIQSLRERSAFVNYAIKKGNFVYALGNDYKMDKRLLHEFDIDKQEWSFKRFFQLKLFRIYKCKKVLIKSQQSSID